MYWAEQKTVKKLPASTVCFSSPDVSDHVSLQSLQVYAFSIKEDKIFCSTKTVSQNIKDLKQPTKTSPTSGKISLHWPDRYFFEQLQDGIGVSLGGVL